MLWYLKNTASDEVYEIEDGVLFGRTEGTHTFPKSRLMSRKHFQIIIEDDFPYVIDLGSRNGTFINGKQCTAHEKTLLTEESIIVFGEHRFQFKKKVVLSTSLIRFEAKKRGA